MVSSSILQAVAVTAELCGRTFSPEAAAVFVSDLEGFPEPALLAALKRCRREVRGVLTVQDVVSRVDDGRPGPEEAWAMVPKDEATTVVWTDEMREAYGLVSGLLQDDAIGARMAFREAYTKLIADARANHQPTNWTASLGHDSRGRDVALIDAVAKGRISFEHARDLVPALPMTAAPIQAISGAILRRIA
jgi:hypothetical protein